MSAYSIVPAGIVLPIFFDSFSGATGASITISGLAVTDIEIYKGVSMTQRSSDNGYTLLDTDGIDLDGITGIQGFSIDLGDNSDAGFYAAGSFYNVVVSAITVDGQTVNFVAHRFRIVAAEGTAGTPVADATRWNNLPTVALPLIPTTAGRTLDVSAGGEAGLDWANMGGKTTVNALTSTSILSADSVASVATVSTVTGSVASVVDTTGFSLSPAGIAAIWAQTITGTTTAIQAMRGFIAAMMGKASGLNTTTAKYRNIADSKDVITATVDSDGNRTSVTLDLS